jgi:diguanylate cyclase (GGDEF)-like protein/PAS domain S-box-containing protein
MFDFKLASIPLLVAGLISAIICIYALRRRHIPHAVQFGWIAIAVTIWTLGYALRINSSELAGKMFWQHVLYLGSSTTPVFLLIFALGRAHHQRWLSWRMLALLMLPAVITMLAVLTNDLHHLMWRALWLDPDLKNTPGPVYWFSTAYSNLYAIASIVILIQAYYKSPPIFRRQAAIIATAAAIPVAVSIITDFIGWDIVPNFDEPTFSLLFTMLIMAWAIFGLNVLDIVPIAHSLVIQNMQDGVMVVDMQDRTVYLNPAMYKVLGSSEAKTLGAPARQVLENWAKTSGLEWDNLGIDKETAVAIAGGQQHYKVQTTSLSDAQQRTLGNLLIFHDVTEQKQLELQLQSLAITDPLTHCYNRRHFLEVSNLELERARRFQRPLSILMLDLDHFKDVNDTFGHAIGDQVLQEIVLICQHNIRTIDLLARFGGEEFTILLPETDDCAALQAAERIRNIIETTAIVTGHGAVLVTVSIGVANRNGEEPVSLEHLLDRAVQAMYASKSAGRNRVTVWKKGN